MNLKSFKSIFLAPYNLQVLKVLLAPSPKEGNKLAKLRSKFLDKLLPANDMGKDGYSGSFGATNYASDFPRDEMGFSIGPAEKVRNESDFRH